MCRLVTTKPEVLITVATLSTGCITVGLEFAVGLVK
jgi:hypothetical protein